jgi:DNA polymerase III subunit gamma/tau
LADQVLYRKYRSSNFDEVVGQDHIVRTLTTAISSGRFSHAYLFTGPRGVGKTSVARLLARALNCTGETKPCNACANCTAAINSSLDVVEIDAASNRTIDSVRDLREKINLAPTQGKYKIYIIDEVHMLTPEAFNALLKTLEEPPAHAVFVLATTEAHKLPETIISRTQRFAFKPITEPDIIAHLAKIAAAEKITIETPALQIVASASRGGFRDAISMLDQLAGSAARPITAETVRTLLGYSASEEIEAIAAGMATGDTAAALRVVARLETAGAQPGQVALQLTELWRTVLLTSAGAITTPEPAAAKLSASVPAAQAAAIIQELLEISRSHWPQLALEASIVKLTSSPLDPPAHTQPAVQRATMPTPTTATTPPSIETPASPTTGNLPAALWPKVLVILKDQNNSLCALLQMYPIDFGDGEVTIKPRFNFHRDLFMKSANRIMIETAAAKVYGRPVKMNAKTEETGPKVKRPRPDPAAELVSSALEILGGEIVE